MLKKCVLKLRTVLSRSVIVLFVSILASMEISRGHYFWNNLYILAENKVKSFKYFIILTSSSGLMPIER